MTAIVCVERVTEYTRALEKHFRDTTKAAGSQFHDGVPRYSTCSSNIPMNLKSVSAIAKKALDTLFRDGNP